MIHQIRMKHAGRYRRSIRHTASSKITTADAPTAKSPSTTPTDDPFLPFSTPPVNKTHTVASVVLIEN